MNSTPDPRSLLHTATPEGGYVEDFAPGDSLINFDDFALLTTLSAVYNLDPESIEWDVATFRGERYSLANVIVAQRVTGYQAAVRLAHCLVKDQQHVAYRPVMPDDAEPDDGVSVGLF